MISYNYDTEEDLNNEICEAVLAVLNSPSKMKKVREKLTFKPSQGLLESFSEKLADVAQWFSEKKNEFIMHMRGYEKAENIVQSELAVIDVGAIISIILNMSSDSKVKNRPVLNGAKKICVGEEMEAMVLLAYKRENENIRVSNNSFCTVMRCQIVYDNPLLNCPSFLKFASCSLEDILNLPG
jgi:D-Tyr-tRNAtyr deacylase